MVDDYRGYKALFRQEGDAPPVREAGCLAHVRRKFVDLLKMNGSSVAAKALVCIGYLYEPEQVIIYRPHEEKRRRRNVKPLVEVFNGWLNENKVTSALDGALYRVIGDVIEKLPSWPASLLDKLLPYLINLIINPLQRQRSCCLAAQGFAGWIQRNGISLLLMTWCLPMII